MNFKQCVVCGLSLPISVIIPIKIKHQGKILIVSICERCKQTKELEAKQNENKNL